MMLSILTSQSCRYVALFNCILNKYQRDFFKIRFFPWALSRSQNQCLPITLLQILTTISYPFPMINRLEKISADSPWAHQGKREYGQHWLKPSLRLTSSPKPRISAVKLGSLTRWGFPSWKTLPATSPGISRNNRGSVRLKSLLHFEITPYNVSSHGAPPEQELPAMESASSRNHQLGTR